MKKKIRSVPFLRYKNLVKGKGKFQRTLQGHDVATLALDHLCHHIIDQAVLVPDLLGLKVFLVSGVIELLEDILEATIVLLQNGVLGAHVQREAPVQRKLEAGVGESGDALVRVVLGLGNTTALEVVDLDLLGLAALGREDHGQLAGACNHTVLGSVLVAKGVTTDDDGLLPAGYQTWDAGDDDGLTEDSTAKDVTDGAVGGEPHYWAKLKN